MSLLNPRQVTGRYPVSKRTEHLGLRTLALDISNRAARRVLNGRQKKKEPCSAQDPVAESAGWQWPAEKASRTLVVVEAGEVFAWGHGQNDRLGLGTNESEVLPAHVGGQEVFDARIVMIAVFIYVCVCANIRKLKHIHSPTQVCVIILSLLSNRSDKKFLTTLLRSTPGWFHTLRVCGGGRRALDVGGK